MATIKQDLEISVEDLKRVYGRLSKYRKLDSMAKHEKVLQAIRERILEDAEVLQEFINKHFKE